MKAEINRIYVACSGTGGVEIIPVGVKVERRSYLDFHGDLFPEVFATWSKGTAREWLEGMEGVVREKVSLDPEKQISWRRRKST